MKKYLTDRNIAILGLVVAVGAFYYGWAASRQNKEIIAHTEEIKDKV